MLEKLLFYSSEGNYFSIVRNIFRRKNLTLSAEPSVKIVFLILFLQPCNIFGQADSQWVKRYNGPGNGIDRATSIAVDGSGNVYVTGQSTGSGTGMDYATIKYDQSGVQQWIQRYNGPGNGADNVFDMILDASGNVYITGGSAGIGTSIDVATIKYNPDGIQQWIHRYNGGNNGLDRAVAIVLDDQGNVYVAGQTTETYVDVLTIKYNSSGLLQWARLFNGDFFGDEDASDLTVDQAGNVYTTGETQGSSGNFDYVTIKYNSSGVEQWVRQHGGQMGLNDQAVSIIHAGSGNIVITGSSSDSTVSNDYATIKYNSEGVQQWIQRYNPPIYSFNYGAKIISDGWGNFIVTGYSYETYLFHDYATVKYNSSGVQQWEARYTRSANSYDAALSMATDIHGNVYVTGESEGSGSSRDYATIKYNSAGVQKWIQRYNGTGNSNDYARSIAVDASGNIYVTGESIGSGSNSDFVTIKYSQTPESILELNAYIEGFMTH